MATEPAIYRDCEALVDKLVERLGKQLVVGLPLGLGKANHLINALYRRAEQDPDLSLTIFTALTLEAPVAANELQRRFLAPVSERLFDDYPPLEYARAQRAGELPDNVQVQEFFLQPGSRLGKPETQQAYTSINYTHALDTLLRAGINLMLQLVAPEPGVQGDARRYSLSCNPDISADLLDLRRAGQAQFVSVGQVNSALPFLGGGADRPAGDFDFILADDNCEFPLYSPPHKPVSSIDYAIGLQVASLIPDGGTLQIGIGSIGDAITHGLLLREQHNAAFGQLLDRLNGERPAPGIAERGRFELGLYGLTEMLVEGFLALIHAGIVKREVGGALVHAAFFIGSPMFYRMLEQLPPKTRSRIAMMPVSFTNELYGSGPSMSSIDNVHGDIATEAGKREARVGARFVNSAMMVTLTGGVVSDGLDNGQVVSGVGGQYNFVAQSFALPGARSIVTLPATRMKRGKSQSNIQWQYGHVTIPRHLRDMVITEYGVADLRDKSDAEVIAAMLNITDSRFQPALLKNAQDAGKLPNSYRIPEAYRNNTPERIHSALAPGYDAGHLPAFPLGSGLTPEEEHLAQGLSKLAPLAGHKWKMAQLLYEGLRRSPGERTLKSLERMQLAQPQGFRERIYRALLLAVLDD